MDTLTKHIAGILASTFKGWRELVFIRIILLFTLFVSTYQDNIAQTTTYNSNENYTVSSKVTIVTDKNDYYPGEWVTITGTGWQKDDSVQLTITHLKPLPNPVHKHDPWFVVPKKDGTIYYKWFVKERELNTSLELGAIGSKTGNRTATYFTDADGDGTITVSPTTICGGASNSILFQFRTNNNAAFTNGSFACITIPANWTAPTNINVIPIGTGTLATLGTITGSGPWVITVNFSCNKGTANGFDFTYMATAPATNGSYPFATQTRNGSTGTLKSISSQPSISVISAPTVTLTSDPSTANQTSCISSSINNITYTISGSITGFSVSGLPNGVSYSYNSPVITISGKPTVSGSFNYTVSAANGTCTSASQTGNINVMTKIDAGNLSRQSAGGRCGVNIVGTDVACSDGSTPVYTWYRKVGQKDLWGIPIGYGRDFFPIPGDESKYRYGRIATCGLCSSDTAQINGIAPYMTINITGSSSSCATTNNGSSMASLTGGTAPFQYTWYYSSDGSSFTLYYTSAVTTDPTNTLINLVPGYYYVRVGDQVGATGPKCNATSSIVQILQNDISQGTITADQTICSGSNATALNGTATGSGAITYQWQASTDNGATWNNISGATNTTYIPTGLTTTTKYQRIATSTLNGTACNNTSNVVTITVNPLPTATISGTTSVCQNDVAPIIIFIGANATPPYTFTYNINGGSNTIITTTSGNSVTLAAPTGTAGAFNYNLVSMMESSSTTCSSTVTGTAAITVNSLPQGSLTANGPFCVSGSGQLTWTATSGTGPFTIIYNDGTTNQTATNVVSGVPFSVYATSVTSTTTYAIVGIIDANGCARNNSFTKGSATITINPLPSIFNVTGGGTFCSGGTGVAIDLSGSQTGVNYQLYKDGNQTGAPLAGTGTAITFESQTQAGTYTVNAVDASTNCTQYMSGNAIVVINSVNPGSIEKGALNPGPDCDPLNPNTVGSKIDATGSGAISYTWEQSIDNGVTWQSAGGGSITAYKTFNPDPMHVTTWLRRVATSTLNGVECGDYSNILTYTVYPLPDVASILPGGAIPKVCVDAQITLTNATPGGVWSSSDQTIATISGGVVTGIGGGSATISYKITDAYGCSKTANRNVTVIPLPDPNPIVTN